MNMTRNITIALLLAGPLLAAQTIRSPGLTLELGGISLQLGMPQDEAIKRLTTVYEVRHQDLPNSNTWTVFRTRPVVLPACSPPLTSGAS